MKRIYSLFLVLILSFIFLAGCSFPSLNSLSPWDDSNKREELFAEDYIGLTKAQISSVLGEKTAEEYYDGALIYKFQNSKMWFWFGEKANSFDEVSDDDKCVYVMAPLYEAADFAKSIITKDELSSSLGYSFSSQEFNEHDGIYMYSAKRDGISCTVSCSEDGTVSTENDYVIYQTAKR